MTIHGLALPTSFVVDRPEIDLELVDWLSSDRNQYFHLFGPPGSGKTSWLQGLVKDSQVRSRDGKLLAVVAAHHFCRWDDASSSSAIVFLQRISQQLADFDVTYAAALQKAAGKSRNISVNLVQHVHNSPNATIVGPRIGSISIQSEKPSGVIGGLFSEPLREALAEPGPVWLLLVDALDEPDIPDVATLVLSLGELPTRLRATSLRGPM